MSLEDDIDALERIELLSDFNREHLRLIAFGSHKLTFSKGYELFHEGQSSDGGYLILFGLVGTSIREGDEQVEKADFGPGSILGEMALITQNTRNFTAVVKEPCELFKISYSTMLRVLNEYPELAVKLHNRISKNIMDLAQHLPPVQEKLMRHEK